MNITFLDNLINHVSSRDERFFKEFESGNAFISTFKEIDDKDIPCIFGFNYFMAHRRCIMDDRPSKFVYSGCSETYGDCMSPETREVEDFPYHSVKISELSGIKKIWSEIVAERLGFKDPVSLALGANNAGTVLQDFIHYISKNGKPDVFVVLFPGLFSRTSTIIDNKINSSITKAKSKKSTPDIGNYSRIGDGLSVKMSKAPHAIEEVLSSDIFLIQNIRATTTLEFICKILDIKLVYSSWDKDTQLLMQAANEYAEDCGYEIPFPSYIETDRSATYNYPDCHREFADHPFFDESFNKHMGIHSNIHVAENFIEELTKCGYGASL